MYSQKHKTTTQLKEKFRDSLHKQLHAGVYSMEVWFERASKPEGWLPKVLPNPVKLHRTAGSRMALRNNLTLFLRWAECLENKR